MASMFPPKKNTAFTLYFSLFKTDGTIIANPGTITKKVSIDGAAVADIAAAVTEEDTTYGQLSVVLSAAEMNGDAIWVYIIDNTSGCAPFTATLYTSAYTLDEIGADLAAVHVHAGLINTAVVTDIPATLAAFATTADVADAVADEVITSGHTGVGALATVLNTIATDTTTDIPATITTMQGVVTTIAADTTTDIPALIDALPTAIENADALLARDIGSTTGAGTLNERTVRAALRILRNKLVIGTTDMTVYKEDDSATAWMATLTTNASAEPISTIDPS